jgi:hypothetical protein
MDEAAAPFSTSMLAMSAGFRSAIRFTGSASRVTLAALFVKPRPLGMLALE